MRRWLGLILVLLATTASAQVPSMLWDRFQTVDRSQPINQQHWTAQGLVAAWMVLPNLGASVWYDLVGGKAATLTNMSAGVSVTSGFGATIRPMAYGQINCDGSNDYVTAGTGTWSDFADTYFGLGFAFRATGAGYLVAKRVGTTDAINGGWFARLDSGGTLTARIVNTDNLTAASRSTNSTALLDGTWRYAFIVFRTDTVTLANNDVTIYINGIQDQGSRTDSGGNPYRVSVQPVTFCVISDLQAGSYLTGSLDDIRFYQAPPFDVHRVAGLYRNIQVGYPGYLKRLEPPGFQALLKRLRGRLY